MSLFLSFSPFNLVFEDQEIVSKRWQKSSKKKILGLRPEPPPYGAAPLPPTQVSAEWLAAVVLDNHNHAHSLTTKKKEKNIASDVVKVEGEGPVTPGRPREDRVRRYIGDCTSFFRSPFPRSWGNPGTVTIPQYRLNKTK